MTVPVGARRMSAYCALYTAEPDTTPAEIHSFCKGPGEVRAQPIPPATRGALIFTVRCGCDCHKTPPIEVLKADAT
ncbi:hypothetical protein SBI_05460 [Streptomyces bingchenggensis BCW-1]|uniref:Uncharacterized protein n=1 Tax=Streptomyces bingchenggensis (strain BCW-1) TaxID=749414 RepID=D7CAL3_STRBB|nr:MULTISPECIES: hypothetical protein [Streptomyces]ADI08580.1 hypothetical protein SBI_05460 [Streptomyces bingchenggensis BCW-1]